MILNEGVTLFGCVKEVLALVEWLDQWGKSNNMGEIIISSGSRTPEQNKACNGSPNSGHLRGRALDFSFTGINVFKIASAMYEYWKSGVGCWAGATEFEVCRGKGKQHFHIGYIPEKEKISFTGVYLA